MGFCFSCTTRLCQSVWAGTPHDKTEQARPLSRLPVAAVMGTWVDLGGQGHRLIGQVGLHALMTPMTLFLASSPSPITHHPLLLLLTYQPAVRPTTSGCCLWFRFLVTLRGLAMVPKYLAMRNVQARWPRPVSRRLPFPAGIFVCLHLASRMPPAVPATSLLLLCFIHRAANKPRSSQGRVVASRPSSGE